MRHPPAAAASAASSPVVELLLALVAIDSTNPGLTPGGAGEDALVRFAAERLGGAGLELDVWDVEPGRPNLVARLRGSGGGRSLLVCGHSDVVGAESVAFAPRFESGRVHGRGALDMKGGIASAVVATERIARGEPLRGDVLLALCIDEEWLSAGAEALVRRHRADAAILPEPTGLEVVTAHGGFAWFEVTSSGVEAAGDDAEHGVDAIALLGPVLNGVAELDRAFAARPAASAGRSCIHASTIGGGTMYPSYPGECRVGIERCLMPGESVADADREVAELLRAASAADARFRGSSERVVGREPVALGDDEPVVLALLDAVRDERGKATPRFETGWMDSGVLVEAGIPCVCFGPSGSGEHTADEWVDVASLDTCTLVLERAIRGFCG